MIINHNIPAIQAYNALTATNSALQKSIQKLSTGLRINSAADDAAGLAISEKMRAQIRGLDRAASNAQDGISMIQTAEGALGETHAILQRMRELSVQAANDTLTQEDRGYIQLEVDQLKEEISRISSTTQFNKKKLLDGSAAVLWSASDLTTKAIVRGGLRQVDQFGQKAAVEGNFKISVNAAPGQGEIQKSDIFKIKHKNVIMNLSMNYARGVTNVEVDNLPSGNYTVQQMATPAIKTFATTQAYGFDKARLDTSATDVTFKAGDADKNASILLEVVSVNTGAQTVTFRVQANLLDVDGKVSNYTLEKLTVGANGINNDTTLTNYSALGLVFAAKAFSLNLGGATNVKSVYSVGDKAVVNLKADATTGGRAQIGVEADVHDKSVWPDGWTDAGAIDKISASYALNDVGGQEIHFKNFYLNKENGTTYQGNVIMTFDEKFDTTAPTTDTALTTFEAAFIGQVAKHDVSLRDLDKFWDANGKFLLEDPKTLTIVQGDGKTTNVSLYATDTLEDLRKKLDEAIALGLGQAKYISPSNPPSATQTQFVSFVEDTLPNTPVSVAGTFVIRSVMPGAKGQLNFSGDEDLIKALSLNVIQQAKETTFTVSVEDAHSGKSVANGVKITGNVLYGVVNPNVDVEFDAMANIEATWDDTSQKFILKKIAEPYKTILHLSDNTTVFQIGANEGEDMGINIGDMSAHALGVNAIIVTDRESAARAITILDNAIGRVSTQRAKLGAYQNRLEHTINNLTTASTNTTAAESRIRDADMAKEMMEFTKLNILSQAGNSMLAQANQLPQNVLALLR